MENAMLDLRLPVGVFFLLAGAILGIDGLLHPIMEPGVNVVLNRDWGAFLFVFGVLMTFFGWRAQRRADTPASPGAGEAAAPSRNGTDR